jgi:AcrR family transcriptional regulator
MTAVDVDGRSARREANRIAVLDTVIAMFAEGEFDATAQEVARRSGVSIRSVYRYVADKEDLSRAAIARHLERVRHLFELDDIGVGTFEERVTRFVNARMRLYEAVGPIHRVARLRANYNPVIDAQLEFGRKTLQEQFAAHFAPELAGLDKLDRRLVTAAADALVQLDSIDHFREHLGLSARATRDVLDGAMHRLFGVSVKENA